MFTIFYKGYYIHGYCHKDECTINLTGDIIIVKSFRAAQIRITKHINSIA